ncbi:MAG: hypothetical protein WCH85_02370 [Methanomicrobiales archaeon]
MKPVKILIIGFVVLLCVLSSGCTSIPGTTAPATPTATPVSTPLITQAPTTVPTIATPVPTATTELIRIMPTDQQVNVLLTKDRTTTEIHLQYQGGAGERFINKVMMRLYSLDGTYKEFEMSGGKKPLPGDEIIVPGTKGKDRCEVFVTSAGTRYKVLDDFPEGGGYY